MEFGHILKKFIFNTLLSKLKYRVDEVFAFTLAEILITLGIIGIIAALTIPTLLEDIQDTQFKSAWKKEYSTIYQAVSSIVDDNGGDISGLCLDNHIGNCFLNLLSQKLAFSRNCQANTVRGNCWHNDNIVKNLAGGEDWVTYNSSVLRSGFILSDGTLGIISWGNGDCNTTDGSYTNMCGALLIDVNGFKPPNVQGKDIFFITMGSTRIRPRGTQGDWVYNNSSDHGCSTTSTPAYVDAGTGCSAQYLLQ